MFSLPFIFQSECIDGEMFNYMKAVWRFSRGIPGRDDTCTLDFHVRNLLVSKSFLRVSEFLFKRLWLNLSGASNHQSVTISLTQVYISSADCD